MGTDARDRDARRAHDWIDAVSTSVQTAARTELLPRFADLPHVDVMEKAPGEVVTDADLACEHALRAALAHVLPEAAFVGEESSHADPSLLQQLARQRWAWVVDPLDGTHHFARGEDSFGVQVALLAYGETIAAWIHLPLAGVTAHAVRGGATCVDGQPATLPAPPPVPAMQGACLTRFLPEDLRSRVVSVAPGEPRHMCSARQYVELIRGVQHYALYYRTLPWDHAPGCLLLACAGGSARRFDGRAYAPADGRSGLLVSAHAAAWSTLRTRLLG